jgi:acyl-CoA synthetase (AMP-forming)/AMP-acid ligase II
MAFADVLRLHARQRPAVVALRTGELQIDYRTLDRTIDHLCSVLRDHGVTRGELTGVALNDTAEHLMVLLALSRVGAVILPIDCRCNPGEKAAVAARFGARRLLLEPTDPTVHSATLHVAPEWFGTTSHAYVDPLVDDDAPLLLSLSSGTTGPPKGPMVSHRQFVHRFLPYWVDLGLGSRSRFVAATPLCFGGGRGFALALLRVGAQVSMFSLPYTPEALVEHVRRVDATALFLVPTLLRRLLRLESRELAFPTLTALVSSGSTLHLEERRQVRQRLTPNLYEFYSSTEGGAISVLAPQDFAAWPDSVGRPCCNVEVEIVDAGHVAMPPGSIGRLRYRSPASARGYHLGDDGEAFRDGWFYPGDMASMNPEGFLFLSGRAKDMIIRGGVNIHPLDIETVLLELPGVAEVAVTGIPGGEMGEEVAAFVVTARPMDPAELIAHCRVRLAPYKVPTRIEFVIGLPKNSLGKILKSELLAQVRDLAH